MKGGGAPKTAARARAREGDAGNETKRRKGEARRAKKAAGPRGRGENREENA